MVYSFYTTFYMEFLLTEITELSSRVFYGGNEKIDQFLLLSFEITLFWFNRPMSRLQGEHLGFWDAGTQGNLTGYIPD